MLRVWFFLLTCIVAVYALLFRPAASPAFAPSAQSGDYIQGAVVSLSHAMAAPLPLMADRDIVQPPSYVPHVLPSEESSLPESLPDTAPELELLPEDLPVDPPIDYSDEWYIPPEAYNSWVITPENTPPADDIPSLGYSSGPSSSGSSGPSTELEYLAAIHANVSLIFYCITLVIAVGVIYMIFRAVLPLFRGW